MAHATGTTMETCSQSFERRNATSAAIGWGGGISSKVGCASAKGLAPPKIGVEHLYAVCGLPQPKAARQLGISLTVLKQAYRRLGVTCLQDSGCPALDNLCAASSNTTCDMLQDHQEDAVLHSIVEPLFGTRSDTLQELCNIDFFEAAMLLDDTIPICCSEDALNTNTTPVLEDAAMRAGPTHLDGWMIPSALWLTPDSVSRAAQCHPNFWCMGPFDVPSAELDALAIKATATIDQIDANKA